MDAAAEDRSTFLGPAETDDARAMLADQEASDGYIANYMKVWAWRPDVFASYVATRGAVVEGSALTERDLAVLVSATASQRGDSYCSLAWGTRLARLSDGETAASVLGGGSPSALSPREAALAAWARQVVRDPNSTTAADVASLREVGLDDQTIFEATAFIAMRLAFSTINDALGAVPDQELVDKVPAAVRDAVTFGRQPLSTSPR